MTFRSIILGLIGALGLCAVAFFNDQIMHNCPLVGDYLPFSIFGTLVLFLLIINPLLPTGRRFTAIEIAIMTTLPLLVGWIPGKGFMRYFTNVLVMPHRYAIEQAGWQASPTDYTATDIRDPVRLLHAIATDPTLSRHVSISSSDSPEKIAATLNSALTNSELFHIAMQHPDELPVNLRATLNRTVNEAVSPSVSDCGIVVRSYLDHHLFGAVEYRWPGLLENLPPSLLASTNSDFATVVDGFRSGLGGETHHVAVTAIPWKAWVAPLAHWLPGLFLLCIATVGMALFVHREWAHHEHLPYPTMSFIEALLPDKSGSLGATFRSRLFWLSFGLIAGIHLYNYGARCWDHYRYLVPLSLRFGFGPIADMFPILKQGNWWVVFSPRIFFVVVGFAYFLASDVSLSLAVSPIVYLLVLGIAVKMGVTFGGNMFGPETEPFIFGGAYVGLFLVLLWTGRHYYGLTLKRALGLAHGATDVQDVQAMWGGRIALVATVLLISWMVWIGVKLPLAAAYVAILLGTQLVMSRILAEGGLIWFGPGFMPCAILWGFLGASGIGPDQLLLIGLVSSVLMMNSTVSIMPFASSVICLLERSGAPIGRTLRWGTATLLFGILVAVAVTLYTQYDRGVARIDDGWASQTMPARIYELNLLTRHRLDSQGLLHPKATEHLKFQISNFKSERPAMIAMGVTLALVLLFTYFRHRFTGWPLHPILFIALGSWSSTWLGFSFFLGWTIKSLVTRYGGAGLYLRMKPFMIGMIAGEMVGVTIPAILSSLYFLITGEFGTNYLLIPH